MHTIDERYNPRLWYCDHCKYVLGVVMRNANKVRLLWVLSKHTPVLELPAMTILQSPVRGLYSLHGVASVPEPGGVECQHCGALNNWTPSKEAFELLMRNYARVVVHA